MGAGHRVPTRQDREMTMSEESESVKIRGLFTVLKILTQEDFYALIDYCTAANPRIGFEGGHDESHDTGTGLYNDNSRLSMNVSATCLTTGTDGILCVSVAKGALGNTLDVKKGPGFKNNDALSLNTGNGFTLEKVNGTGVLNLKTDGFMKLENNVLTLNFDTNSLYETGVNTVGVKVDMTAGGKGLNFVNSGLCVMTNESLTFNENNQLVVNLANI